MARKRKKDRQSPRRPRRYDVEMVRDFLEHLMWEVRIKHFENSPSAPLVYDSSGKGVNPELLDQLVKYGRKYPGSPALLPVTEFDRTGWDEEDMKCQMGRFKAFLYAVRGEQMEALECLGSLFEEALECAAMGWKDKDHVPAHVWTKESFYKAFGDVLDEFDEDEGQNDDPDGEDE